MIPISIIVVLVGAYAVLGLLVGGAYLLRVASRDDPSLRDSAVHVRLLLLPGSIAVWPLLLTRLKHRPEERRMNPSQRKRHLVMWAAVLPLAALMIVLGWFGRTEPPVQEELDIPELPASSSPDREEAS